MTSRACLPHHRASPGERCGTRTTGSTRCPVHEARYQAWRNRERKAEGAYGPEYQAARKRVLARDGHTCYWCGNGATTVDHLVPRAQGGSDDDSNLVAACGSCNASRGATVRRTR